jgi:Kelch motif
MKAARGFHAAALLPGGQVLVAGGFADSGTVRGAELYNPATNRWRRTVPLARARAHASVAVVGNAVLLAGGGVVSGRIIPTAELYDPG